MKIQTRLLLAAMMITPLSSGVMADPLPGRINPGSVKGIPTTSGNSAIIAPAPEPTGPCMADLGVSQVSISKRADGAIFDVSVRITNVGTETVNLPGDVLGVAMRRTANHQAFPERRQIGNVNVVSPGSSVTISASLPRAYVIGSYNRLFITGLERGPDAPRCAYDANRSNDSLSLSYPDMIAAFDGGLATFTKTADWAR